MKLQMLLDQSGETAHSLQTIYQVSTGSRHRNRSHPKNTLLFFLIYFLIGPWAQGRWQNHVLPGERHECPRVLHGTGEWNDLLSTHINLLNISVVS